MREKLRSCQVCQRSLKGFGGACAASGGASGNEPYCGRRACG